MEMITGDKKGTHVVRGGWCVALVWGQVWLEGLRPSVGITSALGAATCALEGAGRLYEADVEYGHGWGDDEREVMRGVFVGAQRGGRCRFLETGWGRGRGATAGKGAT